VVLRPTYFCGGNPVNFAAPLTITVSDGFNQKIDVKLARGPHRHSVVCEVSVKRSGQIFFKGTTSDEGKTVRGRAPQRRPAPGQVHPDHQALRLGGLQRHLFGRTSRAVVINLSPNFVDAGL
jgi:hypothetical protein